MEKNNIEIDTYGFLTIATPETRKTNLKFKELDNSLSFFYVSPSNDPNPCGPRNNDESNFKMSDMFFVFNTKKNKDGTRTLILNGKNLYSEIRRRFENWDVPYMTIYLAKHQNITKLELPNNKVDSAAFINLIDYMLDHNHILELDLRYNQVGIPGINYLHNKAPKIKLQVLLLRGNEINTRKLKKIAMALTRNTSIEHLDVAENDHTEASIIYYTVILRPYQKYCNKTLKILDLSRPIPQCMYYKFDSTHIAWAIGSMLQCNESLEELHLQKFNFDCHDIEEMLKNGKHNKTLKYLDLNCNNIGNHGAEQFSKWLETRPPLRHLFLGHNIISNHGIRSLSRGTPFSKLLTLDVSHNRFDDEGAVDFLYTLKKTPLMENLRMFGNNLGHPTAKIVNRMLRSSVLKQENIDVKPYEVDDTFYFAYYEPKKI